METGARVLDDWIETAKVSGVDMLVKFAQTLLVLRLTVNVRELLTLNV
jgi:hypothetical protein